MKNKIRKLRDEVFYFGDDCLRDDLDLVEYDVLMEAINQVLPDYMVDTVILKYGLDGSSPMPLSSIAEKMGKSLDTIRKHCNQAGLLLTQQIVKVVFMDAQTVRDMIPELENHANKRTKELEIKLRSLKALYERVKFMSNSVEQTYFDIMSKNNEIVLTNNMIKSRYTEKMKENPAEIAVKLIKVIQLSEKLSSEVIDAQNRIGIKIARERANTASFYTHSGTRRDASKIKLDDND